MSDAISVREGYVYGEWRKAINPHASIAGSIHDDAVGRKVGMRGGVVAGIIHFDLYAPVVWKVFGRRWFEQGTVSLFFTYALLHGEEVRVVMQAPPDGVRDVQVETRLESKDGHTVATGTVSVGNTSEKSYLQALEVKSSPPEERRILRELDIGWEMPLRDVSDSREVVGKALSNCEDVIEWYFDKSPWGPPILPLSRVAYLMQVRLPFEAKGVGFYGASELRFVSGPALVDVPYQVKGRITAAGVTSKTEYYWFESELYEKASRKLVATMRHMTRYMKAGSPLYPEVPAGQ